MHDYSVTILYCCDFTGVNLQYNAPLLKDNDYNCDSNFMVDGDVFTYPYYFERRICAVKILQPLTPIQNYFEYRIICPGVECAINIGVVGHDYPLNSHPGWNKEGIGYHADDGYLFNEGHSRLFGPKCTIDDRMGCGIDFENEGSADYVRVFFTKNGRQVGDFVVFKKPKSGLFPFIGMMSRGEQFQYLGHRNHLPKGGNIIFPVSS